MSKQKMALVQINPEMWSRWPNEPEEAYQAFRTYLRMPERNLLLLTRLLVAKDAVGVDPRLQTWHDRFQWAKRSAAYDVFRRSMALENWVEADMIRRHTALQTGRELAEAAKAQLLTLLEEDPKAIPPGVLVNMIKLGTQLQKEAMDGLEVSLPQLREALQQLPPELRDKLKRQLRSQRQEKDHEQPSGS